MREMTQKERRVLTDVLSAGATLLAVTLKATTHCDQYGTRIIEHSYEQGIKRASEDFVAAVDQFREVL